MNWYATLAAARARCALQPTDRADVNAPISAIIENVSRQMDSFARRHFFVRQAARSFTYRPRRASPEDALIIPDLVAVTSFELDRSGDLSYSVTLADGDYLLLPEDAPLESPPRPYWQIARWPRSSYGWPTSARGLRITGAWGCYDVRETLVAQVAATGMDDQAATTTLPVDALTEFSVGQTLLVGDEQLFVTALTTTPGIDPAPDTYSLTVQRAVNGTEPEAHAEDDAIEVYTYPIVSESCLTQVQRRYERTIGRAGRVENDQALRAFASLDRDIQDALLQLRREIR